MSLGESSAFGNSLTGCRWALLVQAFYHNCANVAWADHCIIYNLCATSSTVESAASAQIADGLTADEYQMLRSIQYNLAFVHLDMQDYKAADSLFAQMLDTIPDGLERASLLGAHGALAAAVQSHLGAYEYFDEALRELDDQADDLRLMLVGSLVHLACELNRATVYTCILRRRSRWQYSYKRSRHCRICLRFATNSGMRSVMRP
jgi:tetratricopeptide (TPR) repeat protein